MDTHEPPTISVAVSTHNRPNGIRALIRALEKQTLPAQRFEVVIVDDASEADARRELDDAVSASPLDIKVVHFASNQGPAAGRNAAWRNATASAIAFTDDDCLPTESWLEEGLRAMEGHPSVLVGATEPDPAQVHLIDPLSRTMRVIHAKFAPTCNVFYLRSDLEAVGGFDESFRVPVGEDTDLAWRIHRDLDRELRFCPEALVYHDVRRRTFSQAVRETYRWAGIPPVVSRHTELARSTWYRGYWLRSSHPRVLFATLGLMTAMVFPPAVVLAVPWLRSRIFSGRPRREWITNARFAPAVFAIDLLEVLVLARGSIRHRTLIL